MQYPHEEESTPVRPVPPAVVMNPWHVPVDTPFPLVHFLSNGRYGLLITNAGGGYSQWRALPSPAGAPIRRWMSGDPGFISRIWRVTRFGR